MPQPKEGHSSSWVLTWVLGGACLLSGTAALVYQILWTRQLSLVLGTTVAAVATVLATFMGGLALGSALAARIADRLPRANLPRLYAVLEAGIAGSALLLPLLLRAAIPWLAGLYRAGEGSSAVPAARFLICGVLLLVPTTLMGATLPTLVALLARERGRVGRDAGRLYALNTLGAVAGSLGAALVLLPALGMARSNLLAVTINLAAGGLVFLVFRAHPGWTMVPAIEVPPASAKAPKRKKARDRPATAPDAPALEGLSPWVVLAVIALSGLGALADEVAWARALILLIGPTSYAFAFIVTAVIAGIALGSAAAAPWVDHLRRPGTALAVVEMAAAVSSIAVIRILGRLPVPVGEMVRAYADRMDRLLGLEFLGVLGLLLVPCLLFGAAFPLAVSLLARGETAPGRSTGRTYAWNTLGAIVGALLAGFVALPLLGLEKTLYAAAGVHAVAGSVALVLARPTLPRLGLAAGALGLCLAGPVLGAGWDRELLAGGVYKYAPYAQAGALEESLRTGQLAFYREGRTATVSVKRLGGTLSLAIDGKVDATSSGDMLTQRLLAHVPLLLHPGPRRVCVIGWGSGVTAGSALAHHIESLDAVEISPEVVEASRLFRHVNRDALADPRLRLLVADGRNHLFLGGRRYEVIISEPSNPWMAGVSALFTRDFFLMARSRLESGGLFCQWAHIYNMSGRDLRTVVGSFTDAFPEAALFLLNEGDILLMGVAGSLPTPDAATLERRMQRPAVKADLDGVLVTSPFLFASLFTMKTPALARWASEAERHTDDRPVLEFRAPRFLHANTARENRDQLLDAGRAAPRPEPYASLIAHPTAAQLAARAPMLERAESFAWAYETYLEALALEPRRLEAQEGAVRTALRTGRTQQAEAELRRLAAGPAPVEAGIALALLYHNLDRPREALEHVQQSIRADPGNVRALLLAAEIQESLGNLEAVEALAQGALLAVPRHADAEGFLAAVSLARGRLEEAMARADAVLARHPDAVRALQVAAIARAERGDAAGARRMFERLLAAEPNGWGHLNNFGLFEMKAGNPQAAAELFERAIDINPGNVAGYLGLREAAEALRDPGRVARAKSGLQRLGAS